MRRFGYVVRLAGKSAWNRRGTLLLVVFSIALSTTLLLGIEKLRGQVRDSFVQSVSGTDLVVGARGGSTQLILYSIFHLGGACPTMQWASAEAIAQRPEVAWTIPLSLGDSHRGYPVVATNGDFFDHFRFRNDQALVLAAGNFLDGLAADTTATETLFDVVLGAEVAKKLGYVLGDAIELSHGNSDHGGMAHKHHDAGHNEHVPENASGHANGHADTPFTVTGILSPTGTPVDRSLYIGLPAMKAIHLGWQGGAPVPGLLLDAGHLEGFDLQPENITSLLVGLHKRGQVFSLRQALDDWPTEPLMGVMPGVALDAIWSMINTGEKALLLVSSLVTVTGLAGLAAAILAGLNERRRELAILRSVGARPMDVLLLMVCEGCLLVIMGIVCGLAFLQAVVTVLSPILASSFGVFVHPAPPMASEWVLMLCIALAGLLTSLVPAYRAYRMSLSDGLTVNV